MTVHAVIPDVFYLVTTDWTAEGDIVCGDCLFDFMDGMGGKVAILCRPPGQRCVSCDKPVPCRHEHVGEHTGYPINRSGTCEVVAVCEDCGEQLGQVGWDSVL